MSWSLTPRFAFVSAGSKTICFGPVSIDDTKTSAYPRVCVKRYRADLFIIVSHSLNKSFRHEKMQRLGRHQLYYRRFYLLSGTLQLSSSPLRSTNHGTKAIDCHAIISLLFSSGILELFVISLASVSHRTCILLSHSLPFGIPGRKPVTYPIACLRIVRVTAIINRIILASLLFLPSACRDLVVTVIIARSRRVLRPQGTQFAYR